MKILNMFSKGKPIFSFEIFPPKRTAPIDTIFSTIDELSKLKPNFISVTYGASGSQADMTTCNIASIIKNKYGIESLAHLTGIHNSKEDILHILTLLKNNGIENILALRGDFNPENPKKGDFSHASDLVEFIKENGDFDVCGACYPESHLESKNLDDEIEKLKIKIDSGAEHLITQLFFDNNLFYEFRDKLSQKNINVPIEAGIMPVINTKQIERMVTLCGASLPQKFVKIMQRYENNPEALKDAGIAYAVDQIVELVSNDIDGIHLYTMNKPDVAKKITESTHNLFV